MHIVYPIVAFASWLKTMVFAFCCTDFGVSFCLLRAVGCALLSLGGITVGKDESCVTEGDGVPGVSALSS